MRVQTFKDGELVEDREVDAVDMPPGPDERIAALEDEVRGIKERAAQASSAASNADAKAVGKAVAGS